MINVTVRPDGAVVTTQVIEEVWRSKEDAQKSCSNPSLRRHASIAVIEFEKMENN